MRAAERLADSERQFRDTSRAAPWVLVQIADIHERKRNEIELELELDTLTQRADIAMYRDKGLRRPA